MKDFVIEKFTLQELPAIAARILEQAGQERVFALYGDLGAGKTTLIKALCNKLGVTDAVTSPTFSIINEYIAEGNELVYHFDFYRITRLEEALDIGYEEYLYSGYYCFLEWADKIEELLPEHYVYISIGKSNDEKTRRLTVSLIS